MTVGAKYSSMAARFFWLKTSSYKRRTRALFSSVDIEVSPYLHDFPSEFLTSMGVLLSEGTPAVHLFAIRPWRSCSGSYSPVDSLHWQSCMELSNREELS